MRARDVYDVNSNWMAKYDYSQICAVILLYEYSQVCAVILLLLHWGNVYMKNKQCLRNTRGSSSWEVTSSKLCDEMEST
jgi:hypothetical protein